MLARMFVTRETKVSQPLSLYRQCNPENIARHENRKPSSPGDTWSVNARILTENATECVIEKHFVHLETTFRDRTCYFLDPPHLIGDLRKTNQHEYRVLQRFGKSKFPKGIKKDNTFNIN